MSVSHWLTLVWYCCHSRRLTCDVVGGVVGAEGGADHVVLLQGVYGLAEVGGQEADAAGA